MIRRVHLRHILDGASTEAGAIPVLGRYLVPQDRRGINGTDGWQSEQDEQRLNEEGSLTVRLPNAANNGQLHRDRFAIIRTGRRIPVAGGVIYDADGGTYRPGDEWIEVWEGAPPGGDVVFVGTPVQAKVTPTTIELTLADGYWLTKKTRETSIGYWCGAPRDIFEQATTLWVSCLSDDFNAGGFAFATVDTNTPDWRYKRAESATSAIKLRPDSTAADGSYLISSHPIPAGVLGGEPATPWRLECEIDPAAMTLDGASNGTAIDVGMYDSVTGTVLGKLSFRRNAAGKLVMTTTTARPAGLGAGAARDAGSYDARTVKLAIEGRGRFLFYFVGSKLVRVEPMPDGTASVVARVVANTSNAGNPGTALVNWALLRRPRPYLMRGSDRGDYRVAGAPTPGGLAGSYFDNGDLSSLPATDYYYAIMDPTRQPYARRVDPQINFAAVAGPSWQPAGPASGRYFSARWTGSIYLDLAAADTRLRLTGLDDTGRIYVGKTRVGEEAVVGPMSDGPALTPWRTITTPNLRTHLGTQLSGWYPIIVEYAQRLLDGGVVLERETAPGVWATVPSTVLSPFGIYDELVRYESHYEWSQAVATAWGIQFRCEPRSLESGLFPGELVPRLRVGRDTAEKIETLKATGVQTQLNAEEVADAILADAQGLASDQGEQITAEVFNFDEIGRHLCVMQEYASLADISEEPLLVQRLNSEMALRGSSWEEVAAQPEGQRKLVDRFPLTGQLAELAWLPGDGVRLKLKDIGVDDLNPRQILGVQRTRTPDGSGPPSLSFRQRPRGLRETLKRMNRTALSQIRNYQGQLVVVPGNFAGNAGYGDQYSRVALPDNLSKVLKAELVVHYLPDGSSWSIEVNDTVRITTVTRPDRYDVTAWISRLEGPRAYARMIGGTGVVGYALELLVAV